MFNYKQHLVQISINKFFTSKKICKNIWKIMLCGMYGIPRTVSCFVGYMAFLAPAQRMQQLCPPYPTIMATRCVLSKIQISHSKRTLSLRTRAFKKGWVPLKPPDFVFIDTIKLNVMIKKPNEFLTLAKRGILMKWRNLLMKNHKDRY